MEKEKKQGTKENLVEKELTPLSGGVALILILVALLGGIALFPIAVKTHNIFYGILGGILVFCDCIAPFGLKVLNPNEAMVLVLFGNYYGTVKKEGFYWVNPFVCAVNPTAVSPFTSVIGLTETGGTNKENTTRNNTSKKISLKTLTLNNEKQKVNDELGNPIIIGVVCIWRVTDTVKAVFNVDNYKEFL